MRFGTLTRCSPAGSHYITELNGLCGYLAPGINGASNHREREGGQSKESASLSAPGRLNHTRSERVGALCSYTLV